MGNLLYKSMGSNVIQNLNNSLQPILHIHEEDLLLQGQLGAVRGVSEVGHGDDVFTVVRNLLLTINQL